MRAQPRPPRQPTMSELYGWQGDTNVPDVEYKPK